MTSTPTAARPGDGPAPTSRTATAPLQPLRFVPPRGWPDPVARWVATMAGWEPPVGWVPAPGLPAAAADHVFWEPDPDRFPVAEQPFRTRAGNRIGFGLAALAVAAVVVVATLLGRAQPPGWVVGVAVPGIAALGWITVVLGLYQRSRVRRDTLATVAQTAAERRVGRPAVPYVAGAPAFGAVAGSACAPGAAAVRQRVRRRARRARSHGGATWQALVGGLVVAALAWGVPPLVVGGGAVWWPHWDAGSGLVGQQQQASAASPTPTPSGPVEVGRTVTVASHGQYCLTTCWSWRIDAVRACPSAVAHVDVGTRLGTARAHVVRTADRRLGELPAGTVLRYVEDRTPGQEARITGVRCDGAPGPLVTASVADVEQDQYWAWHVVPAQSCQAATLTAVRDEADDDGTTRTVMVTPLTAAVPLDVALPRPPGAVTAQLLPITC